MRERQRPYLAYLLRLWQVHNEGEIGWRASVENAHTGEKVSFAHLDQLVTFLRERTGLAPPTVVPKSQPPAILTDSPVRKLCGRQVPSTTTAVVPGYRRSVSDEAARR